MKHSTSTHKKVSFLNVFLCIYFKTGAVWKVELPLGDNRWILPLNSASIKVSWQQRQQHLINVACGAITRLQAADLSCGAAGLLGRLQAGALPLTTL